MCGESRKHGVEWGKRRRLLQILTYHYNRKKLGKAKKMTFNELLDKYRAISFSEHDKGLRFELLMKNFLLTYPEYRENFSDVWLWNDFPFRNDFGGKDVGIDIVAKTFNGDFWAVQCKCYAQSTRIDKPAVDSFLATSSKSFSGQKFSVRLWISTTNNWNAEAERAIQNQNPPVVRISLLRWLQQNDQKE